MKQNRSISQRLQRCKNIETRKEIALEWAAEWQTELSAIIEDMRKAERHRDLDRFSACLARLIKSSDKLNALPRVIEVMASLNLGNSEEKDA